MVIYPYLSVYYVVKLMLMLLRIIHRARLTYKELQILQFARIWAKP